MDMVRKHPFERLEEFFNQFGPHTRTGSGAVNVNDRGDEAIISVDIPGFNKEEIDLWYEDRALHITAETSTGEEQHTHRSTFRKTLPLSKASDWDWGDASAEYNNGVLTISVPKPEDNSGDNRIPVE